MSFYTHLTPIAAEPLHSSVHRITDIPELLQAIFIHCLPVAYDLNDVREAPLLLCRVNRRWRELAFLTPSLWSSLSIVFRGRVARPSLEVAARWVRLSGVLPLTISLMDHSMELQADRTKFISLIVSEFWRWHDVRLVIHPDQVKNVPFPPTRHQWLTSFELVSPESSGSSPLDVLVRQVGTSPSLSNFSLRNGVSVQPSALAPTITNIYLTHIKSVSTGLDILEKCPNLLNCRFNFDSQFVDHKVVPSEEGIVHHRLQTLEVSTYLEPLCSLLGELTLPGLQELSLYVSGISFPTICFTSMLTRSGCHLSKLEFIDTGLGRESFLEIASHPASRTLTALSVIQNHWDPITIDPSFISDEVLKRLTKNSKDDTDYLLPKLTKLDVKSSGIRCQPGAFATMVESRCEGVPPSLTFSLRGEDTDRLKLDVSRLEDLAIQQRLILNYKNDDSRWCR